MLTCYMYNQRVIGLPTYTVPEVIPFWHKFNITNKKKNNVF